MWILNKYKGMSLNIKMLEKGVKEVYKLRYFRK